MATTRLIKHHIGKGQTIASSIRGRLDYGKDQNKTRGGELIASYMCDHETADAEFILSKAKYKAITGREQKQDADVLCYQIRQSFARGEIDGDTALKVGYDLAMRWTKGNHAFIVVSHVDREHPHVHIYYNSTALDCAGKFRDFKGSAWALRRLSDRICYEYNLSVVEHARLRSQGLYKHYGQWLGDDRAPSYKARLKADIDTVLSEKPRSFDDFLAAMSTMGYEHKFGRGGALSFRGQGQVNFTRLRSTTLGEGYGQDDIAAIIEGKAALPENRIKQPQRKVNLIIDIQQKLRDGKGPAYEHWAKIYNLKQMAAALQYLQENDLLEYSELEKKTDESVDRFHELAKRIKQVESSIKRNSGLRSAVIDYARSRPVFEEYKSKKYSNKFLAEHEDDIRAYRAAQGSLKELLDGDKLPKMDALKAESSRLAEEKKTLYSQYRDAQRDMKEVVAARANIDHLLGIESRERNKELER